MKDLPQQTGDFFYDLKKTCEALQCSFPENITFYEHPESDVNSLTASQIFGDQITALSHCIQGVNILVQLFT